MKVSFSIPAYNEEAILGACLTAVLKEIERTQADAEVVVVNNASTDGTREVALSFPGVRVVDEMQKGLTFARAAGMNATNGLLIANIDADTIVPEGWLTTVIDAFAKDSRLVALSGPFVYYDASAYTRAMTSVFYAGGYLFHLVNQYVLRTGAMLQGGNFVIRRDAFQKVGGFDTSIAFYGEDTDVARRLAKVGKVLWTWSLPAYSSGRRFKAEGLIRIGWRYAVNHFSIIFLKRPSTTGYKDVRESVR